ncbi:MAG: hypothetical protein ISS16_00980 [Ignavibacteria bacterium]|nr:hypothetical protein [Ignavibacteria bacterium]
MKIAEGKIYYEQKPKLMLEELNSLQREKITVDPTKLKLKDDKDRLLLQVTNGSVKHYPVRRAFLYKLLKWYWFPTRLIYKLSTESIVSVCNDFLLNIKSDQVNVKIENDEALTITSMKYTDITDREILEMCVPFDIGSVSRSDFCMRMYGQKLLNAAPVVDDKCGFGFNILNSETGFRALGVYHYILRYICTNGAIAPVNGSSTYVHYDKSKKNILESLKKNLDKLEDSKLIIIKQLGRMQYAGGRKYLSNIKKSLEALLGLKETNNFVEKFEMSLSKKEQTKYDLFNYITNRAKLYDFGKRIAIEEIAGKLISLDVKEETNQN